MGEPAAAHSLAKVLIVEDDLQLAEFLTDFIDDYDPNIDVEVASDGLIALELLSHTRMDIIIMDLMMPGMNGIELCKQIKKNPKTCDIPIIAMTGYPTSDNIDEVIEAGASAFMGKPLEPDTLRALLRDLTHGRQAMS